MCGQLLQIVRIILNHHTPKINQIFIIIKQNNFDSDIESWILLRETHQLTKVVKGDFKKMTQILSPEYGKVGKRAEFVNEFFGLICQMDSECQDAIIKKINQRIVGHQNFLRKQNEKSFISDKSTEVSFCVEENKTQAKSNSIFITVNPTDKSIVGDIMIGNMDLSMIKTNKVQNIEVQNTQKSTGGLIQNIPTPNLQLIENQQKQNKSQVENTTEKNGNQKTAQQIKVDQIQEQDYFTRHYAAQKQKYQGSTLLRSVESTLTMIKRSLTEKTMTHTIVSDVLDKIIQTKSLEAVSELDQASNSMIEEAREWMKYIKFGFIQITGKNPQFTKYEDPYLVEYLIQIQREMRFGDFTEQYEKGLLKIKDEHGWTEEFIKKWVVKAVEMRENKIQLFQKKAKANEQPQSEEQIQEQEEVQDQPSEEETQVSKQTAKKVSRQSLNFFVIIMAGNSIMKHSKSEKIKSDMLKRLKKFKQTQNPESLQSLQPELRKQMFELRSYFKNFMQAFIQVVSKKEFKVYEDKLMANKILKLQLNIDPERAFDCYKNLVLQGKLIAQNWSFQMKRNVLDTLIEKKNAQTRSIMERERLKKEKEDQIQIKPLVQQIKKSQSIQQKTNTVQKLPIKIKSAQSQPLINIVQDEKEKHFRTRYLEPLRFFGINVSKQAFYRVKQSRKSLKTLPNNFREQQDIGLFYMDLVSVVGRSRSIGISFIQDLKGLKKFLVYKIDVGMKVKQRDLKLIFDIQWQNLVELTLERIWNPYKELEHGLDFITCKKNLLKIKKIRLLGDYLTKKFSQSLKTVQLPSLQVLELNFEEQVDHFELKNIFDIVSKYNDKFEVHLVTKQKDKNNLNSCLKEKYFQRIFLIDRKQKGQEQCERQQKIDHKMSKTNQISQTQAQSPLKTPSQTQSPSKTPGQTNNKVQMSNRLSSQSSKTPQQTLSPTQKPQLIKKQDPTMNKVSLVQGNFFSQQQTIENVKLDISQSKVEGDISIGKTEYKTHISHVHKTEVKNTTIVQQVQKEQSQQSDDDSDSTQYYNRYQNQYQNQYQNRYQQQKYYNNGYRYNNKRWCEDSSDDEGYSSGWSGRRRYNNYNNYGRNNGYYRNYYD